MEWTIGGIIHKICKRDPRHVFGLRKCCLKAKKKFRISRVKLTLSTKPFYITGGRRFWTFRFGKLSDGPQLAPRAEILRTVRFFNFDSNETKKLKIRSLWTYLGLWTGARFSRKARFSLFLAHK